jgi:hypothetical protein
VSDDANNLERNCEELLSFEISIEQFWEAFRYLGHYSRLKRDKSEQCFDIYDRTRKAT